VGDVSHQSPALPSGPRGNTPQVEDEFVNRWAPAGSRRPVGRSDCPRSVDDEVATGLMRIGMVWLRPMAGKGTQ